MVARVTAGCWAKLKRLARYFVHFPPVGFAFQRHWNSPDRIAGLLGQRLGWMSPHPAINVGWMRDIGWNSIQDVEHNTADDRFVVWRSRT